MAVRSLVMPQDTQSITPRLEDGQTKNLSARLPSTEETREPSVPIPEGKSEAIWVEVIRWATVPDLRFLLLQFASIPLAQNCT